MIRLRSPLISLLPILIISSTIAAHPHTRRLQATGNLGFNSFDTDHNGQISKEEYTNAVYIISNALNSGPTSVQTAPQVGGIPGEPSVKKDVKMSSISDAAKSSKFLSAFVNSFSMIIATEIGDKTFFIAAVMSMRNDRAAVFAGAILALYIMTILSSMMGLILPSLVPRQYTHIIGGILFLYFGLRMLLDSRSMSEGKCSDELEEVEEELLQEGKKKEERTLPDDDEVDLEAISKKQKKQGDSWENVLIKALMLTFVAEWGDRSQIATIALAAARDPYGVNIGAMLGHTVCTGMAVIGGRMLAASISEKRVTLWGGLIFLVFGVHSLFFEKL